MQNNSFPRMAVVKQDVNEDLYCCPPGSAARDIISSTLVRPGPVALFVKFNADFYMVETEPDPECNIWKEKWTECRWCPIEWFEAFKDKVPGRTYGQSAFAVKASDVDWGRYDIVISIDVSVPERITRLFPSVAWCYYVREIKTSSYQASLEKPIHGQDLVLNHCFRPIPNKRLPHVIEFPYHLHYYGCFADLFGVREKNVRKGIFLEHHTAAELKIGQMSQLELFGPVASTAHLPVKDSSPKENEFIVRTVDPDVMENLASCKYFVKWAGRGVLGTAVVEAIAAGCLAIGDPTNSWHGFFFTKNTSAGSFAEVIDRISFLENHPAIYKDEVKRQRFLLDYLCYLRPSLELFDKAREVVARKMSHVRKACL